MAGPFGASVSEDAYSIWAAVLEGRKAAEAHGGSRGISTRTFQSKVGFFTRSLVTQFKCSQLSRPQFLKGTDIPLSSKMEKSLPARKIWVMGDQRTPVWRPAKGTSD